MVEHITENDGVGSPILPSGIFMENLKQFDINKLFSLDYIFEKTPDATGTYKYLVFLFGFLILLSIAAWIGYGRLKKKLPLWGKMQAKVFNLFFYLGITGLILIFFRWQSITYLGSRFFMILLALVFAIWGLYILYFRLKVLPKEIANLETRKKFEMYLPRRQAGLPTKKG